MKQTEQKKPKVFRALIRRINMDSKQGQMDNKAQIARKNRKAQQPFFFGS